MPPITTRLYDEFVSERPSPKVVAESSIVSKSDAWVAPPSTVAAGNPSRIWRLTLLLFCAMSTTRALKAGDGQVTWLDAELAQPAPVATVSGDMATLLVNVYVLRSLDSFTVSDSKLEEPW